MTKPIISLIQQLLQVEPNYRRRAHRVHPPPLHAASWSWALAHLAGNGMTGILFEEVTLT